MTTYEDIAAEAIRLARAGGVPLLQVLALLVIAAVVIVAARKFKLTIPLPPGGGPVKPPGSPTWEEDHPGTPVPQADDDGKPTP